MPAGTTPVDVQRRLRTVHYELSKIVMELDELPGQKTRCTTLLDAAQRIWKATPKEKRS